MSTTITRVDTQSRIPWFQMSRQLAQDSRLTFEHRGLMSYLLSKPGNWTVQIADLRREGGIGKDKAYRLLKELQEFGYVRYEYERNEDGSFTGGHYRIYDTIDIAQEDNTPDETPMVENDEPYPENTGLRNPRMPDNSDSEKQGLYNKEIATKEKSSSSDNDNYSGFVRAMERLWGMGPSSPYDGERIAEWAEQVPLNAWEYALMQAAEAGPRARNWRYLTSILRRVADEGIPTQNGVNANNAPSSRYTLQDVNGVMQMVEVAA